MEFNKVQNIIGLKVLSDNVIWLWEKDKSVVVGSHGIETSYKIS